jgi:hypothetical protein
MSVTYRSDHSVLKNMGLTIREAVIYRISFSHSYRIEKSAVQVYISPSLFITENENTKQTCE